MNEFDICRKGIERWRLFYTSLLSLLVLSQMDLSAIAGIAIGFHAGTIVGYAPTASAPEKLHTGVLSCMDRCVIAGIETGSSETKSFAAPTATAQERLRSKAILSMGPPATAGIETGSSGRRFTDARIVKEPARRRNDGGFKMPGRHPIQVEYHPEFLYFNELVRRSYNIIDG